MTCEPTNGAARRQWMIDGLGEAVDDLGNRYEMIGSGGGAVEGPYYGTIPSQFFLFTGPLSEGARRLTISGDATGYLTSRVEITLYISSQ